MPEIESYSDIDPDDFWKACSRREKKETIDIVVEACSENEDLKSKFFESLDLYFPDESRSIQNSLNTGYSSISLDEFHSSLIKLGTAYFRLSNEDIDRINELAKRF